jgi:hypothetical protein
MGEHHAIFNRFNNADAGQVLVVGTAQHGFEAWVFLEGGEGDVDPHPAAVRPGLDAQLGKADLRRWQGPGRS